MSTFKGAMRDFLDALAHLVMASAYLFFLYLLMNSLPGATP